MQKKYKFIIPLIICIFQFQMFFAQHTTILHETFDVDTTEIIKVNLTSSYSFQKWEGDKVLTETNVQLYWTTRELFKFYVEKMERYDIIGDIKNGKLILNSQSALQYPIVTKKGSCIELVSVRIYIPEKFEQKSDNEWVLVPQSEN